MKQPVIVRLYLVERGFQYPQPRVYAMKLQLTLQKESDNRLFQYPQPRVYAMKRARDSQSKQNGNPFSTLNLGSTR